MEKVNSIDFVNMYDPEVGSAMAEEQARQKRNLELIAPENIVSPAVMAAMGSLLTNKYAEGYPGKRYYGGCFAVDKVEEIARKRELVNYLVQNMLMFSLTQVLRLIWQFTLQC